MTIPKPVRVAVLGVGHLGKEHARIYRSLPGVELCGVVDVLPERARAIGTTLGVSSFCRSDELPEDLDAISVATPTHTHRAVAGPLLEQGIHCLIEKPMCCDLAEADELLGAAERGGAIVQVGHVERFNPALSAVFDRYHPERSGQDGMWLGHPRFIEAHRLSPFRFRSMDIDVVFDLMIHDIDIALALVRSPIERIDAIGLPVLSPTEDIANARVSFQNGCVANLTASRVSDKAMRKIRIFSDRAYVSLDTHARSCRIYRKKMEIASSPLEPADPSRSSAPPEEIFGKYLQVEEVATSQGEPLARELESFVEVVRERRTPVVSGQDARAAIELATRILEESRRRNHRGNESSLVRHGPCEWST